MSEIQIALLSGSFALFGVIVASLTNFLKERWQYKYKKNDQDIQFLSPVCFFLSDNLAHSSTNFDNLNDLQENTIHTIKNIEQMQELMKNNMHVLPMEVTIALSVYIQVHRRRYETILELSEKVDKYKIDENLIKHSLEELEKFSDILDEMTIKLLSTVSAYMKKGIVPKAEILDDEIEEFKKLSKEIKRQRTT